MELNKIHNMDCVKGMQMLDNECIDLTVTSPPYDNLRTYNGFTWDFESTAKELYRVTKQGGVVVWIVGDATIKGSETGTSFRQALYFIECGFNLHDTMIYAKNNPIPLTHNRYEQQFEYMFVLSKGKLETFNPIKKENKQSGAIKGGNFRQKQDEKGKRHKDVGVKKESYRRNVWFYNIGMNCTTKDKEAFQHPAIFPEQLANDHIISWSNENDIVLDPFIGSGTTAKMAIVNNRNYIGFELSKEYCEIANKRTEDYKSQIQFEL